MATGRILTLVAVGTLLLSTAFAADTPATPPASPNPNPNAKLIVGGGSKHNSHGSLTTAADGLSFESKGHTTKVSATALQKVTVGSEARETGGLPMTAAKMAVPYGGGRVVSLFAHAKFDTLTVEYRDENGGVRGLVFELPKGQADALQTALGTITPAPPATAMTPAGDKTADTGWAIQIGTLKPGDTEISQEFLVATYEYLVEALEKSHKFVAVLRSGDSTAAKYPKLLVLNTDVSKFVHGNEEARAVTTVKGWTKLAVKMHIETSDGRSVIQKDVESNVRFYGNNMRATETLAHSMSEIATTAPTPQ
jgi:hypothetical protein